MKTHLRPTVELLQNCLNEVGRRVTVTVMFKVRVTIRLRVKRYR